MGKNLENQIREGLISSLFFEKTGKTLISSPPRGGSCWPEYIPLILD